MAARPDFPLRTPMLVMRFETFKGQGRIPRSDEALAQNLLEEFDASAGHIVVFISHKWWRTGHPDYTEGDNAHGKFRTVVSGVEKLILKNTSFDRSRFVLWMDWFSISQTDPAAKLDGIASLIKYVTLCKYMLIVVEEWQYRNHTFPGDFGDFGDPSGLKLYGDRAWCRLEWLTFYKWAQITIPGMSTWKPHTLPPTIPLYAVAPTGQSRHFGRILLAGADEYDSDDDRPDGCPGSWPADGKLSNEEDRPLIRDLQEQLFAASVDADVSRQFAAAVPGGNGVAIDLGCLRQTVRDTHIPALVTRLQQLRPTAPGAEQRNSLDIKGNRTLTIEGIRTLADFLASDAALEELNAGGCDMDAHALAVLVDALKTNTGLKVFSVYSNGNGNGLGRSDSSSSMPASSGGPPSASRQIAALKDKAKLVLAAGREALEMGRYEDAAAKGAEAESLVALCQKMSLSSSSLRDNDHKVLQALHACLLALAHVVCKACVEGLQASKAGSGSGQDHCNSVLSCRAILHNLWQERLATALAAHPKLEKLNVDKTGMTDEGATALARVLTTNTTLQELNVRSNQITDEGATALARALTPGCALKTLYAKNTAMTRAGKGALRKAGCEAGVEVVVGDDSD